METAYEIRESVLCEIRRRLKEIVTPMVPFRHDRLEMAHSVIAQDQRLALEIINMLPLPRGWDEKQEESRG
jgi:hypothetical protein